MRLIDKLTNGIPDDPAIIAAMKEYKQWGVFDVRQLSEIYAGLTSGVDVSVYATPVYTFLQMCAIRHGLEEGIDVKWYEDPSLDLFEMAKIHDRLLGVEEGTLLRQIFGSHKK